MASLEEAKQFFYKNRTIHEVYEDVIKNYEDIRLQSEFGAAYFVSEMYKAYQVAADEARKAKQV